MGKITVTPCGIKGLYVIEPTVFKDERGYFVETYNQNDFKEAGLDMVFVQDNQSMSVKGVLRGLHFQKGEHAQAKLVRVLEGTVLDVAVDIRRGSPTYGKHVAVELTGENKRMMLIPRGFAHGFSVLSAKAVFAYKCDNLYCRESEGGIRFDDPALGIDWRIDMRKALTSEKDRAHPFWTEFTTCFS